jgi:hypothetical protein
VVQVGSVDAYSCANARGSSSADVSLEVGGELGEGTIDIGKAKSLCTATSLDGAAVANADARLACYRASSDRSQPFERPRTATLTSPLLSSDITISALASVCLPAAVDGSSLATSISAKQCYRAAAAEDANVEVAVSDELGERRMRLLRLESVCVPVRTAAHGVSDPAADLACFRARRARGEERFVSHDVSVATEIGTDSQTLRRDDRVCVPASVTF